ncbi:MAG: protein-disulfide reductase DsbD domain-containing protein [Bacteroidota bacterium]
MKRLLTALLLLVGLISQAQIEDPVHWSYSSEDKGNGEYELVFKAKIDKTWHIYGTKVNDVGPLPTTITFDKNSGFTRVGGLVEKGIHKFYDDVFEATLYQWENQAEIRQKIKLTKPGKLKITGSLEYQACVDNGRCLPPSPEDFTFEVGSADPAAKTEETAASSSATSASGIENPVQWTFTSKDLGNNTYEIQASAAIQKGWHLYGMDLGKEAEMAGPVQTSFKFPKTEGIEWIGKVKEPKPIEKYDPNFMMKIRFHENKVVFTQQLTKSGNATLVKGTVNFMVCNDEKCLPPVDVDFTVDLATGQAVAEGNTTGVLKPNTSDFNPKIASVDLENPMSDCGEAVVKESKSFLNIFILGFLGGLIALLTPCVFPMIPLTVSFFTKGSKSRKKGILNASIYGGFIFLIYILLSLPFHFLDSLDPEILNTISTNVWLNLTFFVIFIVFAISFFGYFEITLPSSLANKADSASEIGGLIGTFFMALTLALVSFSCTGPILGSLLAGSLTSDGGAMQLTAGMGGFGLALALPFTVFALFPGMLKSLPKSGGWLTTVKVVLGFIEVALAAKFLSTADLVGHWGILKIEAFLAIWILVGIGLSLYLFGKIRFPHDSPVTKLSMTRKVLGTITVALTIYFCTGFMYDKQNKGFRSLELLSGLAPASGYSWIYPSECPLNLSCFHDYEEGMAYAKKVNKPVLLDFTGYGCVNCRKMEDQVWGKPDVFKYLNEDFVVISLYVDDREKLPESEQFDYINPLGKKKKIRTIGDKWTTLETETFKTNSQPHYAILSPDEKLLNHPVAYTPQVAEYKAFLECGLETFRKTSAAK